MARTTKVAPKATRKPYAKKTKLPTTEELLTGRKYNSSVITGITGTELKDAVEVKLADGTTSAYPTNLI